MPWDLGPSVVHRDACDYWRTWFFEECESSQLFGVTEKHLPLITRYGKGVIPYRKGTRVFLEDAPCFRGSKTHHRVCGPYEVFSPPTLPPGAERVFPKEGPIIVYKAIQPERGPWLDRSSVKRKIDGIEVRFQQIARRFAFFPFRFAIRRAPNYRSRHIAHAKDCWLCS